MTTSQPAQIPGHEPSVKEASPLAAAVRRDDPELCAGYQDAAAGKQRRSRGGRWCGWRGGACGKLYVPAEMVRKRRVENDTTERDECGGAGRIPGPGICPVGAGC